MRVRYPSDMRGTETESQNEESMTFRAKAKVRPVGAAEGTEAISKMIRADVQ